MKYHDEIITITLCRGDIATALGERGLMTTNWSKMVAALQRELWRETPGKDDGHCGVCAVGELLVDRLIEEGRQDEGAIVKKPDSGPHECWPFVEKWWNS